MRIISLILLLTILNMFLVAGASNNFLYTTQSNLGTFKQNTSINLVQISDADNCNISAILTPNGTKYVFNVMMDRDISYGTFFSYLLDKNYTKDIGTYAVFGVCYDYDDEIVWAYNFDITPSGFSISSSQGLSSLGLIVSIILIAGMFMFLGYKFSETDKTFPIGIFFLSISLLLCVYALHLGYIYTRDILYPLSAESVQFKIYLGIMWGLIAIIFISMLYLIIKILKEFKERKSLVNYGEYYNPKTKQYEY